MDIPETKKYSYTNIADAPQVSGKIVTNKQKADLSNIEIEHVYCILFFSLPRQATGCFSPPNWFNVWDFVGTRRRFLYTHAHSTSSGCGVP